MTQCCPTWPRLDRALLRQLATFHIYIYICSIATATAFRHVRLVSLQYACYHFPLRDASDMQFAIRRQKLPWRGDVDYNHLFSVLEYEANHLVEKMQSNKQKFFQSYKNFRICQLCNGRIQIKWQHTPAALRLLAALIVGCCCGYNHPTRRYTIVSPCGATLEHPQRYCLGLAKG